jgi:predicted methyltransferase
MTNVSWLIEYRQSGRTTDYIKGFDAAVPRIIFTKDAADAAHFDSKEAAEPTLEAARMLDPSGVFAVEDHAFNCGIADALEIPRFLRKNDD